MGTPSGVRPLILDSEALSLLASPGAGSHDVMAAVKAAALNGRGPMVPAVVLAEHYRSHSRVAAINALLERRGLVIEIVDTDRTFAKYVGGVLGASGADSRDMVDAHCVAVAVIHGGGTVLTSDVEDLERLAAPFHHPITIAKV